MMSGSVPVILLIPRYLMIMGFALLAIYFFKAVSYTHLERLDYILLSPSLMEKCKSAAVHNGRENEGISDHYPVSVILEK